MKVSRYIFYVTIVVLARQVFLGVRQVAANPLNAKSKTTAVSSITTTSRRRPRPAAGGFATPDHPKLELARYGTSCGSVTSFTSRLFTTKRFRASCAATRSVMRSTGPRHGKCCFPEVPATTIWTGFYISIALTRAYATCHSEPFTSFKDKLREESLFFVDQILRLRLRMTLTCHFRHLVAQSHFRKLIPAGRISAGTSVEFNLPRLG